MDVTLITASVKQRGIQLQTQPINLGYVCVDGDIATKSIISAKPGLSIA